MQLSIVTPMYNEEDAIPFLMKSIQTLCSTFNFDYEFIVVDDGSSDSTVELCKAEMENWPELRVVALTANRGHMSAIAAGYEYVQGDYVVTLDADLQDPPELIPTMLEKAIAEKLDVVYAVRSDRTVDTRFKAWTASIYYSLIKKISGTEIPHNAGDFRLVSRQVVKELNALPERQRIYRLLVPWLGYPSGQVEYARMERVAGKSHYPLSKMFRLGMDSITSFSSAPLRISTYLGMLSLGVTFIGGIYVIGEHVRGNTVQGWASIMLAILFFGSVQLVSIGLLGEYIARIFVEVQHRPIYSATEIFRAGSSQLSDEK